MDTKEIKEIVSFLGDRDYDGNPISIATALYSIADSVGMLRKSIEKNQVQAGNVPFIDEDALREAVTPHAKKSGVWIGEFSSLRRLLVDVWGESNVPPVNFLALAIKRIAANSICVSVHRENAGVQVVIQGICRD